MCMGLIPIHIAWSFFSWMETMWRYVTRSAITKHNSTIQFFSIKHWNTMRVDDCTFRQKIHNFFTRLVFSERRSDNSLNLCNQLIHLSIVWVQCSKAIISYGCYVVKWCQSRCLWLMFLNQLMDYDFVLWQCRVVEGITYPLIHSSARGKHNGTNFESAQHSICKLCPF